MDHIMIDRTHTDINGDVHYLRDVAIETSTVWVALVDRGQAEYRTRNASGLFVYRLAH
jgi:hypothetical protein